MFKYCFLKILDIHLMIKNFYNIISLLFSTCIAEKVTVFDFTEENSKH